jgi:hypothetical protein
MGEARLPWETKNEAGTQGLRFPVEEVAIGQRQEPRMPGLRFGVLHRYGYYAEGLWKTLVTNASNFAQRGTAFARVVVARPRYTPNETQTRHHGDDPVARTAAR